MRTIIVRSGVSSGLMWGGIVIVVAGIFTGVYCVALRGAHQAWLDGRR